MKLFQKFKAINFIQFGSYTFINFMVEIGERPEKKWKEGIQVQNKHDTL